MNTIILGQFKRDFPYFWEGVSVHGMLVWFLTKDFADLFFLDNFFTYSFHLCQSNSAILFI